MSTNQKNMSPSEVNPNFTTQQDMISYRDAGTGTQKTARKDAGGNVITENLLGAVKAGAIGQVVLVNGTVTVTLVVAQALRIVQISVSLPGGAAGFLSVLINIPGGSGGPAQFTISSTSNTDTSTIDFIGYEDQA